MTYDEIVAQIPRLTVQERTQLMRVIADTLAEAEAASAPKKRSILEFEGIAKRLSDNEDPQEYLKRLRSEWDERP